MAIKKHERSPRVRLVTVFLLIHSMRSIPFDSCGALDLRCGGKKRVHKYLQTANCCLWECHSLRITKATDWSGNNSGASASTASVQMTFYLHGHGMARGVMYLERNQAHKNNAKLAAGDVKQSLSVDMAGW